jgi:hypothetical protein
MAHGVHSAVVFDELPSATPVPAGHPASQLDAGAIPGLLVPEVATQVDDSLSQTSPDTQSLSLVHGVATQVDDSLSQTSPDTQSLSLVHGMATQKISRHISPDTQSLSLVHGVATQMDNSLSQTSPDTQSLSLEHDT